jgi:hypothetical protein
LVMSCRKLGSAIPVMDGKFNTSRVAPLILNGVHDLS